MTEESGILLPYPAGSLRRRTRILVERYLAATLGVVAIDGGPAASPDLDRRLHAVRQTDGGPHASRSLGSMRANWVGTDRGLLYISAGATHWELVPWGGSTITPFVGGALNRTGVTILRQGAEDVRVFAKPFGVANLLAIAEHYGSDVQRDDERA
jgi:hypothetical protein